MSNITAYLEYQECIFRVSRNGPACDISQLPVIKGWPVCFGGSMLIPGKEAIQVESFVQNCQWRSKLSIEDCVPSVFLTTEDLPFLPENFDCFFIHSHDIGLHMGIPSQHTAGIPMEICPSTTYDRSDKFYIFWEPLRQQFVPRKASLQWKCEGSSQQALHGNLMVPLRITGPGRLLTYLNVCWQEWPSNWAVRDDKEFEFGHFDMAGVQQQPAHGPPVIALILVLNVLGVTREIW